MNISPRKGISLCLRYKDTLLTPTTCTITQNHSYNHSDILYSHSDTFIESLRHIIQSSRRTVHTITPMNNPYNHPDEQSVQSLRWTIHTLTRGPTSADVDFVADLCHAQIFLIEGRCEGQQESSTHNSTKKLWTMTRNTSSKKPTSSVTCMHVHTCDTDVTDYVRLYCPLSFTPSMTSSSSFTPSMTFTSSFTPLSFILSFCLLSITFLLSSLSLHFPSLFTFFLSSSLSSQFSPISLCLLSLYCLLSFSLSFHFPSVFSLFSLSLSLFTVFSLFFFFCLFSLSPQCLLSLQFPSVFSLFSVFSSLSFCLILTLFNVFSLHFRSVVYIFIVFSLPLSSMSSLF